jgi:DNA-binding HxlR family transcriptional regulator
MKKNTENQKIHVEMQLSQIGNKVDISILKELEEKFERNIKTLKRDILIQNKKIDSKRLSPDKE